MLANITTEAEPSLWENELWPLVRREPLTAIAVNADTVGGLPSFPSGCAAWTRASRLQGGMHEASASAGAIADEGMPEADVGSPSPEGSGLLRRRTVGHPFRRVLVDRSHQSAPEARRCGTARSMHAQHVSAGGGYDHQRVGRPRWARDARVRGGGGILLQFFASRRSTRSRPFVPGDSGSSLGRGWDHGGRCRRRHLGRIRLQLDRRMPRTRGTADGMPRRSGGFLHGASSETAEFPAPGETAFRL